MKKNLKRKNFSVPREDESDLAALINRMHEKLGFLEKKIDILVSQSSRRPADEKHFSKPFQRFEHPRHHERGDRDNNFRERSFTRVICSDCGKECEVPFKPSGDRPVYCKECFAKRKDSGRHKDSHDNKPREQIFIPDRAFDKHKNRENRKPGRRKKSGFKRRK
ncbi:MAG: CxxC-x17-CxxC domain-containing protein [Candidatus Omnitrophota bacterium]